MTLDKKRAKYESQLQELEAVKKSLTQKIGKHFESFEKLDENDPKLGQKKKDLKDKIKRATQELQNQALDEKIHHMQSKLDDLDESKKKFCELFAKAFFHFLQIK